MILESAIRFLREDDGPTAVEYAVMLALIIVGLMASIGSVGNSTNGIWQSNVEDIEAAITPNL